MKKNVTAGVFDPPANVCRGLTLLLVLCPARTGGRRTRASRSDTEAVEESPTRQKAFFRTYKDARARAAGTPWLRHSYVPH